MLLCALYTSDKGYHVTMKQMTSDKCSHAEIKRADGCKAESRDRQVDTCLASFRAEPEVTGRLEPRRQQFIGKNLSLAYIT